VAIEFKLAHHKQIKKGVRSQLPKYLSAIGSKSGLYVVMWFKDAGGKYYKEPTSYNKESFESWLMSEASLAATEGGLDIRASVIDASIKPSASK
jgi:hypothetical protein